MIRVPQCGSWTRKGPAGRACPPTRPSGSRRNEGTTSSRSRPWPPHRSPGCSTTGSSSTSRLAGKGGPPPPAVGRIQGDPPQAQDRPGGLRHQGPSRHPVPGGRRPGQGGVPVPRPRAHSRVPGPRPAHEVRGAGQGSRCRRAAAAARRQVDVDRDRVDPQAKPQAAAAAEGRAAATEPGRRRGAGRHAIARTTATARCRLGGHEHEGQRDTQRRPEAPRRRPGPESPAGGVVAGSPAGRRTIACPR